MLLPKYHHIHISPRGSSSGSELVVTVGIALISLVVVLFFILLCVGYYRSSWSPGFTGERTVIIRRARPKRIPGLARGVIEGLPIIRFEERERRDVGGDIEMSERVGKDQVGKKDGVEVVVKELSGRESRSLRKSGETERTVVSETRAVTEAETDIRSESNCSICLEEFIESEEIRLLPCNHKFHPKCVDPWLENVSGTCPTCRYDLTPRELVNNPATP